MIPLFNREPVAIAAAVIAVLNVLQLMGFVSLTADAVSAINIALVSVLGLFVRQSVTPTAAPTLAQGSEVIVKGTSDLVLIQPSPPGPVGVEDGAP